MAIVCPTVTAENMHHYREQFERLRPFAKRIHIDFMDGLFTRNQSISLEHAWLPSDRSLTFDIHLMYMRPDLYLEQIFRLKPHLVIIQAEAKGAFYLIADKLHAANIKVGVALMQETAVHHIAPAINDIDHVLIFSGHLGHFGGKADLKLLNKVKELKRLKSDLEIGWDGGINEHNVSNVAAAGVNVLNVGGYIQNSTNPSASYAKLEAIAEKAR